MRNEEEAWSEFGLDLGFDSKELELQKEPDDGSNAESGSSNPVIKPKPRA